VIARAIALTLLIALAAPTWCFAAPAVPAAAKRMAKPAPKTATAVFAGGCFWCLETQFETFPGVKSVVSGYTGGHKDRPTYEEVCAHTTGHYEAVRIVYDPTMVSYAQLLDRLWHGIDPTQGDGQFCDIGESYRSAIFWQDSTQRSLALDSKRELERSGVLKSPIVTAIVPGKPFWPAEEYHQDFWKKDPVRYRSYRAGCGRDRRLAQLWGAKAVKPLVH